MTFVLFCNFWHPLQNKKRSTKLGNFEKNERVTKEGRKESQKWNNEHFYKETFYLFEYCVPNFDPRETGIGSARQLGGKNETKLHCCCF